MKDKAGGCYGEKHSFKSHAGVAIGQQKSFDFCSGGKLTAPTMSSGKATNFNPGTTSFTPNVGGKRA